MPEATGYIGLGLMGKPMAANRLKAGCPAHVAHPATRIMTAAGVP